jgi:hypothetical protein
LDSRPFDERQELGCFFKDPPRPDLEDLRWVFAKFAECDANGITATILGRFAKKHHALGARARQGIRQTRKRRKPASLKPRPLTDKQREAVGRVGRHNGNRLAAAAELGMSRQLLDKHYKAGMKKLERYEANRNRKLKRQALPTDPRGQSMVEARDDE